MPTSVPEPRVELVRPDGPASLDEWFAPLSAADKADWPDEPGWLLHERAALLDQPGLQLQVLGVARLGVTRVGEARVGEVVAGCFQVRMPLRENLSSADLEIWVDPAWQGRGVGRTLLSFAERIARDRGRTCLSGTSEAPVGSPERAHRERFARAAGYEPALEEAKRGLELPCDPGLLDALEKEARAHSSAYRLVTWAGPCPAEWVPGRLQVARGMSTDIPKGERDVEPEEWDTERLRHFEQVVKAMDRASIAAAAIAPDGALAGYTEIGVPRAAPAVAYQFDTIVLAAHRGHRLGLRLKAANLRRLQEGFRSTRRIVTVNAASNDPMIAVNERLGFRLVGTGTVWQKRTA